LDARTDIYSTGAILYELVTGRTPFDLDSAFALMQAHISQMPAPPSELNPETPPALDGVILKAMAKKPQDRFQSADSFRHELEIIRGEMIRPVPQPHSSSSLGRFGWRKSAMAGACASAGLMLMSALLGTVHGITAVEISPPSKSMLPPVEQPVKSLAVPFPPVRKAANDALPGGRPSRVVSFSTNEGDEIRKSHFSRVAGVIRRLNPIRRGGDAKTAARPPSRAATPGSASPALVSDSLEKTQ
jgi:serine/threonine-protein kinase